MNKTSAQMAFSARGSQLNFLGIITLDVYITTKIVKIDFAVAKGLSDDCLLALAFLTKGSAMLDFVQNTVIFLPHMQAFLIQEYTVKPNEQALLPVRIQNGVNCLINRHYTIRQVLNYKT